MKRIEIHRKGYKFRLYMGLISLFITAIIIVLMILIDPPLSRYLLYGLLGYVFIYLVALILINMSIKKEVYNAIKKNLKVNNTDNFFYLDSLNLSDRIFLNSETKLLGLISHFHKSNVNLIIFSKDEIKKIRETSARPEGYSDAKKEYNDALKAAKSYNKHTVAGGLVGGVAGAAAGVVIDGLSSNIPDNPDKSSNFNFTVGLFIELNDGYSAQLEYASAVPRENKNSNLKFIREFISKVESL